MELYWKALGGLLIAVVLGFMLGRDMAVVLSLAVCAMATVVAMQYLQPILSILKQIEQAANMQGETFQILMKILGISMVSEIAGMVCNDAGASAMGRVLKILTCTMILWLAIPVFQAVLSILQQILGEI